MARASAVPGVGPDLSAREAARALAAARLADARRLAAAAIRAPAPDAIHDLRVALRRLRAALELFGAPGARDDELRRLMGPLGACRDATLRIDWLKGAGAVGEPLRVAETRRLEALLPRAVASTRRWLDGRGGAFEAAVAQLAPRGRFGGHRLRRRVAAMRRKVARRLRRLPEGLDPAPVHRLRVAAKKLRYAVELLEPAGPSELRPLRRSLGSLQSILGELHDADVRIDWLAGARLPAREREALLARARAERTRLARRLARRLRDANPP